MAAPCRASLESDPGQKVHATRATVNRRSARAPSPPPKTLSIFLRPETNIAASSVWSNIFP